MCSVAYAINMLQSQITPLANAMSLANAMLLGVCIRIIKYAAN